MCMEFKDYKSDIEKYCKKNGLNFEKAMKMVKGCGSDQIILQYFDKNSDSVKKGLGLLDETPMPVVLLMKRVNGNLVFEQTEHTRKYLA